ncbi:hypothetical protein MGMO_86c00190 [Methyloglobulus morosus KoM1]|uniref:Uncharacterized protein n=1 Tax=Methyloglobulus morosus KoM1 TaxID=1116472 RepID=V5BVG1_9GAMM|nr:hypothetical protein [Methyloglobulus morosus]ESS71859.1 hypothetical protein MGMO_86c00190 [Methyloglobulus morosus KoM1]
MNDSQKRKKSPRVPSIALDDAIERVMRVYEKERLHAAPIEVIAQDLGYKSANNGAALGVIASLRYYGLLERPQEGKLSVAKEVETYKFSPSENMRNDLLIKWLKTPAIFLELLEKYEKSLPSDAALKYDLIQLGFIPTGADSVIQVFKKSIEYAKFFEQPTLAENANEINKFEKSEIKNTEEVNEEPLPKSGYSVPKVDNYNDLSNDRIPVRLSGGRRAWLEIPTPLYSADKLRLKAQIDLLLTDDEVEN